MKTHLKRAIGRLVGAAMFVGALRAVTPAGADDPPPEPPDQNGAPDGTEPEPASSTPPQMPLEGITIEHPPAPAEESPEPPAPAPQVSIAPAAPPTESAAIPAARPSIGGSRELRLNFQNAPLIDVLQYLSEAGGFIILQETPVSGTVNIIARTPLTADEAVDLLNTLLAEKGYAALRSGRILRIVDRRTAARRPLPVFSASRPEDVRAGDELATQIIPLRFTQAVRVVENLSPLLAEGASLTANEASNSLILTDTGTNARRIIEIVRALDDSIAGIAEIRVFPLRFAKAADIAKILTDFFAGNAAPGAGAQALGGGPMGRMFFMQRGGGDNRGAAAPDARTAAIRVAAVADERTNSVIVNAPQNLLPAIEEIIARLDADQGALTRYFQLERADAMEAAEILRGLFGANLTIVGDARTNTVLVRAPTDFLIQIAEAIGRLDATDARTQQVFVYPIRHGDPENIANIMQGMFPSNTRTGSARSGTAARGTAGTGTGGRLAERSTRGASTDASMTGSGSGSTRSTRR